MSAAENVDPMVHPAFADWHPRISVGFDVETVAEHDHAPLEITAGDLLRRFSCPPAGPKGSAGYYLAGEFAEGKRKKGDAIGPAAFVPLDLDSGGFEADDLRLALDGVAFVAHTSSSHMIQTKSNPDAGARWRVIVPIVGADLSAQEYEDLALELHEIVYGETENKPGARPRDLCGSRLTQPMFWPVDIGGGSPYEVVNALDQAPISVEEITRILREARDERCAAREARESKHRAKTGDGSDVIGSFNEAHSTDELFEKYGYTRTRRTKWIHPDSTSLKPSEVIFPDSDRWYSHRGSAVGSEWQSGDAFDLFRLYEHGGDQKAAVRAAAKALGLGLRSKDDPERAQSDRPESRTGVATDVDARDFFDRELGFLPETMGHHLEAECRVIVGEGGRLYRYTRGVYKPDAEEWVASRVRETLGKRFKRRHREETFAWFKSSMPVDTTCPPLEALNVANGLLRWDDLELEPHRRDFVTTVQSPVAWKPGAKCPLILAFLRGVLPDEETVQFVLEVIGYALYPKNLFHASVLLRGPGRNGKSVLLAIIQALLGSESVAAVPLQQFSENRFASASLVGKLANICGDIDARAIKRTDVFKMLTGGDPIWTERKYGQSFSFVCFALPIFSANEPPMSADQSEAWFERWLVVPMDKTIPPEKRDANLAEKLTTAAELEGLLVEAVHALKRLLERGGFELPGAIREAQAEYRERLDSVSSFIEGECRFGPNAMVTRRDLAAAYKAHCRDLELHAVGAARLYERIAQADPGVRATASGGVRGFRGVGLR